MLRNLHNRVDAGRLLPFSTIAGEHSSTRPDCRCYQQHSSVLCKNGKYFSGELTRRHILIQLCHNSRSLQALIRAALTVEF